MGPFYNRVMSDPNPAPKAAQQVMQRFVALGKAMPDKRDAAARRADFDEVYGDYRPEAAAAQAGRCSQCGVPFCQVHCPLHNNIPDWLKLAAEGRLEEAYEVSQATNNMPEICGRIGPQDRLCEGDGGIALHTGVAVGQNVSLVELRQRHDALLIATGVYQARDVVLPGAELADVYPALAYLIASNRKGLGDAVPAFDRGDLNAAGKRVVVIGGGDTAMDCVRTAVRQGARSVQCLYRRNRANMPGSLREVAHAEEEGIEFVWLAAPESFQGTGGTRAERAGGKVKGVRAQRIHLGVADASGRHTPQALS